MLRTYSVPSFLFTFLLLLAGCGEPPGPAGAPTSAPASTGGENAPALGGGAASSDGTSEKPVGGSDGPAYPELRTTRGAIQPVTEFKATAGKSMEQGVQKIEEAIVANSVETAEEQVGALLDLLASEELKGFPERSAVALVAALQKDLAALKERSGAPKLTFTSSEGKLCGKDKTCSVDEAGATCTSVAFTDKSSRCVCAKPDEPAEGTQAATGADAATGDEAAKTDEAQEPDEAAKKDKPSKDSAPKGKKPVKDSAKKDEKPAKDSAKPASAEKAEESKGKPKAE